MHSQQFPVHKKGTIPIPAFWVVTPVIDIGTSLSGTATFSSRRSEILFRPVHSKIHGASHNTYRILSQKHIAFRLKEDRTFCSDKNELRLIWDRGFGESWEEAFRRWVQWGYTYYRYGQVKVSVKSSARSDPDSDEASDSVLVSDAAVPGSSPTTTVVVAAAPAHVSESASSASPNGFHVASPASDSGSGSDSDPEPASAPAVASAIDPDLAPTPGEVAFASAEEREAFTVTILDNLFPAPEPVSDSDSDSDPAAPLAEAAAAPAGRSSATDSGSDSESSSAGSPDPSDLASAATRLVIRTGHHMIPHPEKAYRGGEDAWFYSDDCSAAGVADGVGGWSTQGIDPGLFSRNLMKFAQVAVDNRHIRNPVDVLWYALEKTNMIGSCTACVAILDPDRSILKVANLGDSGILVVRGSEIAFRSEEQQHYFNCPFQLGTHSTDTPDHSQKLVVPVQEGDVVILGTDGLWDNLFDEDILTLVATERNREDRDQSKSFHHELAERLAYQSHRLAKSALRQSPFARKAREAGYRFFGGKMDDVTVVVATVERHALRGGSDV